MINTSLDLVPLGTSSLYTPPLPSKAKPFKTRFNGILLTFSWSEDKVK